MESQARVSRLERGASSEVYSDDDDGETKRKLAALASQRRAVALLVFAITLHNFPEGLAVGVGFGGATAGVAGASRARAWNLAVKMGVQSIWSPLNFESG